tara:strand:- start:1414 stop:2532 length:1119 start_codon:yes stop_codon:yes gene_type:complete
MGIKDLHKVLSSLERNCSVQLFKDLNVGIDGHGWLYRSAARTSKYYALEQQNILAKQAQNMGQHQIAQPTTNPQQFIPPTELVVQESLKFFISEIKNMLNKDVNKVILVFDGDRIPIKQLASNARKKKKKQQKNHVKITKDMYISLSRHLKREFSDETKFQIIHAPYEADAQLGYLYQNNIIDIAISEDYDLLCYGCKHVFSKYTAGGDGILIDARHLYACDWKPYKNFGTWTDDMFLTFCILCGCDYLDRLPLVGPVKAFDSVNAYKTIDKIMKSWENNGSIQNIPENYLNNFRRSRLTFLYAIVIDKNNQRVHLNTVKNEDLKYIGNYLGTINKNHHGTGVDHSSNKKHNLVSSSLSTINHGRYSKRQRF